MANEKMTLMEAYDLLEGLIHIKILAGNGSNEYSVIEEKPTEKEQDDLNTLIQDYRKQNLNRIPDDFQHFSTGNEIYRRLDQRGLYFLERYYTGYGIIQPLMSDPRIEDITCDGVGIPIYVFIKEYGFVRTNIKFNSEDSLNFFIRKLAQEGGKQISVSVPVVEVALLDGSRVSASLGRYVTTRGPSFSIRKFREIPISPIDLIRLDSTDFVQLAYLWTIIEYGANVMVVGGTATGKTTFLNAILSFVSPDKKVVTIEDTKELNLKHENWISTVTRTVSTKTDDEEDISDIDMFDLLESALRHRPNYIVVGEVRGAETFTVFQAMLAGRFGMGTFHADDMETFVHRLEARPISIPRNLITSLNTVIMLDTTFVGGILKRGVKEISEIVQVDAGTGELIVNRLLTGVSEDFNHDSFESHVFRLISMRDGVIYSDLVDQMVRRMRFLMRMEEVDITDFDTVHRLLSLYKVDEKRAVDTLESY